MCGAHRVSIYHCALEMLIPCYSCSRAATEEMFEKELDPVSERA